MTELDRRLKVQERLSIALGVMSPVSMLLHRLNPLSPRMRKARAAIEGEYWDNEYRIRELERER